MARPKSRSSSFGNKKKSTGKPSFEKKGGAGKRSSSFKNDSFDNDRKSSSKGKFTRSTDERTDKKPFDKKDKKEWGNTSSFERKSGSKGGFKRKEDDGFSKKPFDKKEKKEWSDKPSFERKSTSKGKFSSKTDDRFEKKSFDKRDKKEWSDKSYDDKKSGLKGKFTRKSDEGFEKKSFDKREKKEWSDKPSFKRKSTEKGDYTSKRENSFDKKPFDKGEKKEWSNKTTSDRKPKSLSKWDKAEGDSKKKFTKNDDRNPKWKSKSEFESEKTSKPNAYTEKSKFKRDQFGSGSYKKRDNDSQNDEGFSLDEHQNKKKSFERGKNEYNRLLKKSEKNIGKKEKNADDGMIRLNRYIANTGVCSRRDADKLIESGAVMVNGRVVTQLGTKIGPHDKVQYGGQTIKAEKMVYILLNKPKDYITTMDDPQGRKTVMALIRGACRERVYPVGRLDRNTTGVLLFTNDGELTRRLTHPKFLVSKMYHVEVDQNFDRDDLVKMRNGLELEDGFIKPDQLEYSGEGKSELGIEIHSGRNRIVRRMFEHLGYEVIKLDRVMFAGLSKKDTPRGKWRFLNEKEVGFLKML